MAHASASQQSQGPALKVDHLLGRLYVRVRQSATITGTLGSEVKSKGSM